MGDNYIYRFLIKIKRMDLAETYELMPFEITTQTIERTLVDKVFALCDYYMQEKTERHSRHLYDIHKIVETMGISDELPKLIPEVRAVHSEMIVCPSAKEGVCVADILREIIKSQVYKSDYEDITMGLLFVPSDHLLLSYSHAPSLLAHKFAGLCHHVPLSLHAPMPQTL